MVASVMGTNRSIYLFTPERPRDLSARAPGPASQEYYNIIKRHEICLFYNFARRSEHLRAYLKRSTTVKRVLCAFALYGLVSYPGSLTLTSSGRYAIHWLNFMLKVVAAILANKLAKFLTSLLALLTNVYVAYSVLVY